MDSQQHGRISAHASRSNSPNPPQQTFPSQYEGLDPNVTPNTFTSGKFNTAQHLQNPFLSQSQMNMSSGSAQMFAADQFNQHAYQSNQFSDPSLGQAYSQNQFMSGDSLNPSEFVDQEYYMAQQYNVNAANNVNPADLNKISSPDHASPGSGLLSPETHNSPGPQIPSPTTSNGNYHTPQHSRHTSLDPSSAYDMSGSWQGVQFQQHRRLPSDQYSDVSSHSPYLGHSELNDSGDPNKSPFLTAQDPNTYGIESFNITDPATSQPGSTYVSPRLMPSQGLGVEPQTQDLGSGDMFANQQNFQMGAIHNRQPSAVSDIGQADQYAMPIINIEPAPVSRQASFGPNAEPGSSNALSPPSNSRGRNRSQSDTTGMTRPINSRSASPSGRQASDSLSVRSTSPGASHSRESSPGVQSGRISKDRDRRASTSSMHSRDYILDLADPQRPNASPSSGSSRVQKHPATFQCTLCPKKFTRAYNLRSHLRTHTDERPFVCTVCGKAFARQHDRKRHEGLHSGEKKFVCKGELNSQPGQTWGCGRRFARADALGRHFRSEAGRVCIKPLLDEEAAERRAKQMMDHQHMNASQMGFYPGAQRGGLQPVPPAMIVPGMSDDSNPAQQFALPAALMAQYPQLANLDWNAISQQNMQQDEGDLSDVGYDGYDGDGMDDPNLVSGMAQQGYPATSWVGPG